MLTNAPASRPGRKLLRDISEDRLEIQLKRQLLWICFLIELICSLRRRGEKLCGRDLCVLDRFLSLVVAQVAHRRRDVRWAMTFDCFSFT